LFIDTNRLIYDKCKSIYDSGSDIDVVTVADSMSRDGYEDYVYAQVSKAPVTIYPTIKLIKELSIRRQVQETGREMLALANNHAIPVDQVIADASERAFSVNSESVVGGTVLAADEVDDILSELERRRTSETPNIGIASGYFSYDCMMGGFHETNLTILAARPAMGKTALAMNFAARQAIGKKIPVLFFSLEMSTKQLMFRLFAQLARVDNTSLRLGTYTDDERTRLDIVAKKIKASPLYISDKPQTVSSICVETRRAVRKHGIKQVYVDYLQKIKIATTKKGQTRDREVTELAEGLKDLAKTANVNVTALCQLNRGLESRDDKRPIMADLRESGGIEQEADEVLVLYRPNVYDPNSDPRETELIVRKHRNGELGTIPLMFHGEWFRFDDVDLNHVNTPESFNSKSK
jgi:replicative DNA helicase